MSINRLGSSNGVARCMYSTFDMSAIAGKNYIAIEPTWVEFAVGETSKEVVVDVLPTLLFEGTLEFGLYIDEKIVEGAAVGKYLHTCSVKIIDKSFFPTKSLREWVKGGNTEAIEKVPSWRLIVDFVQMCWSIKETNEGTKKVILAHQYNSFHAILTIFITLYVA